MVELFDEFMRGNHRRAYQLHSALQELFRFFEYEPGYVAPCKEALKLLGLPAGPVRKPLPSLTPGEVDELRRTLVKLGLRVTK